MTKLEIPYVQALTDRHGHQRYYFRRKGTPRFTLHGQPNSEKFQQDYQKALAFSHQEENLKKVVRGSVHDVILRYKASPDYTQLAPDTYKTYNNLLRRIDEAYGQYIFNTFTPKQMREMLALYYDKPDVGNRFLSMFSILGRTALEAGLISQNPVTGVRKLKIKTVGFHTWQEEDIAGFEAAHAEGTRARLAISLLLYTAQRRSDIIAMGWQDVRDGLIYLKQSKTGNKLAIPIHATLKAALENADKSQSTFLVTAHGKAFTPAGFTNWFRDCVREAKINDKCSPHGLRKAAARRLAEAGCTVHEIMAITGHKTMSEVLIYTQAANQIELAKRAMKQM